MKISIGVYVCISVLIVGFHAFGGPVSWPEAMGLVVAAALLGAAEYVSMIHGRQRENTERVNRVIEDYRKEILGIKADISKLSGVAELRKGVGNVKR